MSDSRVSAPSAGSRRRCRRGDESGAALVEFALVVGLFVFVLYGLVWFGMMLALKQGVTNAAAEGRPVRGGPHRRRRPDQGPADGAEPPVVAGRQLLGQRRHRGPPGAVRRWQRHRASR